MCFSAAALAGPAVNQFEVKDLQSAPGDFEFQSQNAWTSGQPLRQRRSAQSGETIYDDNTVIKQREAQEVQLGITDWFRVRLGVEFEQERIDEPLTPADADKFASLKFNEVAIEGVFVLVKPKAEGVGLGLLMEYGSPVAGGDEAAEFYVGPILEAHTGSWSFIANLMFVKFIGGAMDDGSPDFARDEKWDFSYATQLQYDVSRNWGVALEAYGTWDRLGNSGTPSDASATFGDFNQHRAGPIVYYTFFPGWGAPTGAAAKAVSLAGEEAGDDDDKEWSVSVGSGVLFGLNENTPDFTYKLSVEIDY